MFGIAGIVFYLFYSKIDFWCIQTTCYCVYQLPKFQGCAIAVDIPQTGKSIYMDNITISLNTVASFPTWPKCENVSCWAPIWVKLFQSSHKQSL